MIATIHVRSWQAAYQGVVPAKFLASMSVGQREGRALAFYRSNGFVVDGIEKTVELGGTELVEIRLRKALRD